MSKKTLRIETELGTVDLMLRPDAAPLTVRHIQEAVQLGLYNNDSCFYRSDFVIQCGLHGTSKSHPKGSVAQNETHHHVILSNTRGTAALAHHDVPDNGSTEFFINLENSTHLDTAYGGYCVFAVVESPESMTIVDKIATSIAKEGKKPRIISMSLL